MTKLKSRFTHFIQDDSGQDLVEYALIVALISLTCIASLHRFSQTLSQVPNEILYQILVRAYS